MVILILANHSGGLYNIRGELLRALLALGHTVYVSVPDDGCTEELAAMGCRLCPVTMERRGKDPVKDLSLYRAYRRLMSRVSPELVITYTIKPNIYGGWAARRCGVPYVVNVTGQGSAFQKRGLLRSLVTHMSRGSLLHAETVFFENREDREDFLRMRIARPARTVCLPGAGVDPERYAYAPYPPDGEVTRFLFIGRIMREKGVEELLEATGRLIREGIACELHLLGCYEEALDGRLSAAIAAGWLYDHGFQADVRPYIVACHAAVLPSWHEGMANVNLECAAMGRPVITSRIPGCREAVIDGVSGFLVPRRDADALYKAMRSFVMMTYEERQAMGVAGRRHVTVGFDRRSVVARTLRALPGVLDTPSEKKEDICRIRQAR